MSILLSIFILLLAFPVPWVLLLERRARDRSLEGFFDRVCLGYAISFVALYLAAQLRLWLFLPVWGIGALAGMIARTRIAKLELGMEGRIVLGCAALYLGLRALPFVVRTLPLGWDAYFHMTIAESIFTRGSAVRDWLPYEDMPLNYPIGVHLVQALVQWLVGVRPHVFFDLMIVLFTLLTGLQLFSLAARATRDRFIGCYAALAYLFLANWGSLHYVMWSGLPNLIGMYLFLGLLTWIVREQGEPTVRRRWVAGFVAYFLAICFVHHHVMVTAGLCLAWSAMMSWFLREREQAKRIVIGLVASGLAGAPYFGMYIARSVSLTSTRIGSYMEATLDGWGIASKIGFGFAGAAIVGIYLAFRNRQHISAVVTQSLVAMIGLYVLVDYVVRILSQGLFEEEISPFTPSRFITDAVTLLSVFAGVFFRTMQAERVQARIPLVAMILAGFWIFNRGTYRDTFRPAVSPTRAAMYEWIRTNTPPDTVVLDSDWHATYLTQRMTSGFPLPTSEYSALAANRMRLQQVADGKQAPESIGRPIVTVVTRGKKQPRGKQLWRGPGGYRVIQTYVPPPR